MEHRWKNAKRQYESHQLDMVVFKKRLYSKIEDEKKGGLSRKRDGWTMKKIALATAAVLGIGFSVSVAVSPTMANYVSSFLNRHLDNGVQNAVDKGYAKWTGASVTDQGITIKVADVMADPARLVVSFQLEDGKGEKWVKHLIKHKENKMYVTDENGQVLTEHFSQYVRRDDYGYYQFVLGENTPKKLQLHMELKKMETRFGEGANDFIDGDWKLTVPIDMDKSLTVSKTVPLEKTIETTPGLTIKARSIEYTPSAARLTLEATWTEEARKRLEGFGKQLNATETDMKKLKAYDLNYRIKDADGNEIVSSSRSMAEGGGPLLESFRKGIENGVEKDVYDIVFLPPKQHGEMTFELDGVTLQEPSLLTIPVSADTLAKGPVSKEGEGLRVTVESMSMEQEPESKKTMVALHVREEYKVNPNLEWYLTDEKNRSYDLKNEPVPCQVEADSNGDALTVCERTMFVKGMEKLPKKAELKLRMEPKYYGHLNSRLSLPMAKE
ncbi:DUF4179 domain-containing protein [Brevibacillus borstelensis]|uniref:DUF4179 domain-containing protein n=1 Tax=Brevibacillus borstelensis TaxID=45462 RepID=UPI0030BD4D64